MCLGSRETVFPPVISTLRMVIHGADPSIWEAQCSKTGYLASRIGCRTLPVPKPLMANRRDQRGISGTGRGVGCSVFVTNVRFLLTPHLFSIKFLRFFHACSTVGVPEVCI